MRKWRSPEVPAGDESAGDHQIVVPKIYRSEILILAHETPLSGYSGIKKNYLKFLNYFYWPGLKTDVSHYCRSCHTCQVVGKSRWENPQKLTQLSPRSHPRHLVGKKDSTKRRHSRHRQRQPGEQLFPIQMVIG